MSYREHPLPPALSPWVECVWERTAEPGDRGLVLPDGCIDVIWTDDGAAQLVGANTTAFVSQLGPGRRVVGARMRPGGAPALLGIDARAVRDARPALDTVLGDAGRRLVELLHDDRAEPVVVLRRWLAERAACAAAPDPLVTGAVARLRAHRPDHLAEVAGELGVSDRGLRRRMTAAVGYGPKRLARVLRLRRALAMAAGGEELAAAAFLAGYADQAHLSHDCRELAGAPPSALLAAG